MSNAAGDSSPNARANTAKFPRLRRMVIQTGKRVLRRVGQFQARHSLVGTTPVLDNAEFPWVAELEQGTAHIQAELDTVLGRIDDIPAFHQLSPDQHRISKGNNWKTYAFYIFGKPVTENCEACPYTAELLASLPSLQNAWFSILAPRYHIPPHRGPTRALIRCHLGLRVPAERERCWLRVDDQICTWEEGRCLVFDDTYEHEVKNDTDEVRVVLFLDFDRPMDLPGRIFNRLLLRIVQSSAYVKDPLRNLAAWNA
ncbi:MAG: aspartyl/asparaginyl beta-hydroxylase domain-containing protein, partial [Pseudomonadales bacterium]